MSSIFFILIFFIRFLLFFIASLFLFILVCPLWLTPKWTAVRMLCWGALCWSYISGKIFGLKIKVHGNKKNVKGLIVSNHLSYMDIFVLGSIFPLRFAPKIETAKWPLLGLLIGIAKPIWINRKTKHSSQKTTKEFTQTIKHNINLIAFPEGTTGDGKRELYPFKSTVFETAVQEKIEVYPVLLSYEKDNVAWPLEDTTPLIIHAWRVLQMLRIKADLFILDPVAPDPNSSRKQFSQKVYHIMNNAFKNRKLKDEKKI